MELDGLRIGQLCGIQIWIAVSMGNATLHCHKGAVAFKHRLVSWCPLLMPFHAEQEYVLLILSFTRAHICYFEKKRQRYNVKFMAFVQLVLKSFSRVC